MREGPVFRQSSSLWTRGQLSFTKQRSGILNQFADNGCAISLAPPLGKYLSLINVVRCLPLTMISGTYIVILDQEESPAVSSSVGIYRTSGQRLRGTALFCYRQPEEQENDCFVESTYFYSMHHYLFIFNTIQIIIGQWVWKQVICILLFSPCQYSHSDFSHQTAKGFAAFLPIRSI